MSKVLLGVSLSVFMLIAVAVLAVSAGDLHSNSYDIVFQANSLEDLIDEQRATVHSGAYQNVYNQ